MIVTAANIIIVERVTAAKNRLGGKCRDDTSGKADRVKRRPLF